MSEHLIASVPVGAVPYASLEELKAEHSTLLRRRRDGFQDDPSVFLGELETFLARGYATGRVLGDEAERYASQSLLTYWSNVLYREGREVPEAALAEFDPATTPELVDTECPYLRMDQLAEGQTVRSPGWHRLMDECISALKQDHFLAVVGASGSGRSTLIQGGVVPALLKGALDGSEDWRYLPPLLLGADPLSDLLRHLNPQADKTWIEQKATAVRAKPAEVVALFDEVDRRPIVLIVEQLDELFQRSDKTQIRTFAEALLELAQDPSARFIIIIGTRPDKLSLISAIGRFGKMLQRNQVLMTFTNRELRQMVEEPAKRIGLKYDDGVVDRLLLDVQGDPAALSLLQFTLLLLWNNREGNRITHEIYDRLGGGRLAVSKQAEQTFSSLTREEQRAAKLALLKLVRLESGSQVVCRSVPRRQLDPPEGPSQDMNEALKRLEDGQILVPTGDRQSGDSGFGLVHEAVATAWPRFVEWLDEVRAQERWHLQLRAAAEQWRDQGKNVGALWRGGTLQQAEAERARLAKAGVELPGLEREFLQTSQSAETRWIWMRRGLITSAIAGSLIIAGLFSGMSFWKQKAAQAATARAIADKASADAKASAARSEADAKQRLADQEKQSRQDLGLKMAHWSTGEAIRLDESESDSAGSFLWLGQAWNHVQKNAELLKARERDDLQAEYRLRLGIALRGLPRISQLLYHKDFSACAVSDDGRYAATVGLDGTVFRWNVADGTHESWRLAEKGGPKVNSVCLSPDGSYAIVCTGADGPGQAFVCEIGTKSPKPLAHDGPVTMAAIRSHARDPLLVTVSEGANHKGQISVWKVGTWKREVAEELKAPGIVKHIAVWQETGPQGRSRLAVSGKNEETGLGFCREWDLAQLGNSAKDFYIPAGYGSQRSRTVNQAAYSADGKYLAVACGDEGDNQAYAYLFSVSDNPPLSQFLPHAGAVTQVAFSPNGKKLVTASHDGTAKVWVFAEGAMGPIVSAAKPLIHGSSVFAADFSPDGQYVATASRDRRARVWDAETGDPVSAPLQHSTSVVATKFTPDGRQLITQSIEMVHVWDLSSGPIPPYRFAVPSGIDHVRCDPSTLRVTATGYDVARNQGWAQVWDGQSGKELTPNAGLLHPSRVICSALAPKDGNLLVTVCDDSSLRIWNLATGQRTCDLHPFPNDQLRFVTLSPDGGWLVAAGGDRAQKRGVLGVWKVSSDGKIDPASTRIGHGAPITFAAFNKRGDHFVTVTGETEAERGEAKIWDLSTGTPIELTDEDGPAHPQGILSAAFSENGDHLVTASIDNSARVWKVEDGSLENRLEGHTADLISASFNDRGDQVATSSMDRTVIVWNLKSAKQIAVLAHKNPVNKAVFSRDSRYVVTACRDGAARIWALRGGGRLVAINKQPGAMVEVGYAGDANSKKIGMFSLKSLAPSWENPAIPVGRNLTTLPSDNHVGVGVWDISPGAEPSVERLLPLVEVIAARHIQQADDEVKLETMPEATVDKTWQDCQDQKQVLSPALALNLWHDRMAAVFEAKGAWPAAIWHLDRLESTRQDLVATLLRRARAYVERGRADQTLKSAGQDVAIEDLNQVLTAEPQNGRAYVERARIRLDRQEWNQAALDFSKAINLIQGDKQLWMGRAEARTGQKNWAEAIADYQAAVRLDPEDGAVHRELARSYRASKDWPKAAEEFDQAAKRLPNDLELRMDRADALAEQTQKQPAINEYAAVAREYKAHRLFEKAATAYERALAFKPEREEGALRSELAETWSWLRRPDDAIKEYAKAVKIEPAKSTNWIGLARVHGQMQHWAEAKEAYSQAINLNPRDIALVQSRAWVLSQMKDWDLAARDYETAVGLPSANSWLWMRLVEVYLEAAKLDEAIRCLDKMPKANLNDEVPELRLATLHLLRRDLPSYRTVCKRLLDRFEPTNVHRTANNVAWVCTLAPDAVKDANRTVRLAKRARELQPANSTYIDTLGAALYRSGDMEGTIKLLGESVGSASSPYAVRAPSTVLYDHLFLAMAYHRAGRVEDAKALLETVVGQLATTAPNKVGSPSALALDAWQRRELGLLRDEAETLIKPKL